MHLSHAAAAGGGDGAALALALGLDQLLHTHTHNNGLILAHTTQVRVDINCLALTTPLALKQFF